MACASGVSDVLAPHVVRNDENETAEKATWDAFFVARAKAFALQLRAAFAVAAVPAVRKVAPKCHCGGDLWQFKIGDFESPF